MQLRSKDNLVSEAPPDTHQPISWMRRICVEWGVARLLCA